MEYVVEALVAMFTVGWIAREFLWMKNYRATCSARLRRASF